MQDLAWPHTTALILLRGISVSCLTAWHSCQSQRWLPAWPTYGISPQMSWPTGSIILMRDTSLQPLRQQPPTFAPHIWNVHQATIDGTARTNNMCEALNSAFTKMIGHVHPSFWMVVSVSERTPPSCQR